MEIIALSVLALLTAAGIGLLAGLTSHVRRWLRRARPAPSLRAKRFNERVKLGANTLNAIGLGLFGTAILVPAVRDDSFDRLFSWTGMYWISVGLLLHLWAHWVITLMRQEEKE